MFPAWLRNGSVAIMAALGAHAFAGSPAQDRLLRLVPANAEIVAGIQDPHHADQTGRLLIVTHNDDADLRDWIALAGAMDARQQVDKLIEAAGSSPRGELSEHLLLAGGSFRGAGILHAAESDGGVRSEYKGVRIVELKPFAREQQEMRDTRWLAMLNDNTAIFGSPAMVRGALDRYLSSAPADAELVKRMSSLKPDVNCWSILRMLGRMMAAHVLPSVLDETSAALLRRVTNLSISVHYGSKDRVDFIFGTENTEAATALATAISGPPYLRSVADTLRAHLESVAVRQNEVRGSVRVAEEEFAPWLAGLRRVTADANSDGENVARAGAVR
jgi:hypothetical protein